MERELKHTPEEIKAFRKSMGLPEEEAVQKSKAPIEDKRRAEDDARSDMRHLENKQRKPAEDK